MPLCTPRTVTQTSVTRFSSKMPPKPYNCLGMDQSSVFRTVARADTDQGLSINEVDHGVCLVCLLGK